MFSPKKQNKSKLFHTFDFTFCSFHSLTNVERKVRQRETNNLFTHYLHINSNHLSMKRILLFAVASLLMVGASAQPPQGPRGSREFHGPQGQFHAPQGMQHFQASKEFKGGPRDFRAPRGPQGPKGPQAFRPRPGHKNFTVVALTEDEVAARFARHLRLDSEKAAAFAPIFTAYRAALKEVMEQNPVTFKPKGPKGPKGEKAQKPTEEQIAEMKAMREKFAAQAKAIREVRNEYKESFLEVLSKHQYRWLQYLERDMSMYVKFVRQQDEEKTEEEPQATAPARDEDLAAGIGSVEKNDAASTWYSVDGTRVTGQPTKSGIYVVDGKKVMVK